jgi:hypothetical protein
MGCSQPPPAAHLLLHQCRQVAIQQIRRETQYARDVGEVGSNGRSSQAPQRRCLVCASGAAEGLLKQQRQLLGAQRLEFQPELEASQHGGVQPVQQVGGADEEARERFHLRQKLVGL